MTKVAGEAPHRGQAHVMTATATAMAGEAPRWQWTNAATTRRWLCSGGEGEGNCGGDGSNMVVATTETTTTTVAVTTTTTAATIMTKAAVTTIATAERQ